MSLTGILRVWHDEKNLHRTPLFASWISSDYVGAREVLVDPWSGLPSIAIIEDPLVGPALQVASDVLVRVPAWKVFARFGTLALVILMTIAGLFTLRAKDGRLWMRLWPLIASATLISYLIASAVGGAFLKSLATVSPLSVGLLVLSLAYPAVILLGAAHLLKAKTREPKNLPYWFAAVFVVAHAAHRGIYDDAWGDRDPDLGIKPMD